MHHPHQAASDLLPTEAEVMRPDGTRVIRRIIPFNSCMAGTCGFPAQNLTGMRSAPSSAAAAPMLELAASAPTLSDLLADRREPLYTLLPDVPWYVLQYGACGPPGAQCNPTLAVSGGYNLSTAPYKVPNFPLIVQPNPNFPSSNPSHENVMRHWANMSQDNPVQVYIVVPQTQAAAGQDIFLGSLFANGPLNPATPYSYTTWISDITATFAKFAGVPTAGIYVNVTPVFAQGRAGDPPPVPFDPVAFMAIYDPVGGGPPPAPFSGGAGNANAPAHLIWDWSGSLAASPNGTGPTGNGFNEVIFLRNRGLGTTGMASMDLDPTTGAIVECDVIFHISAFNAMAPGPSIQGAPFLPNETTAFVHEIGHFFGLDHTNLHPGNPPAPSNIVIGVTPQPSWMNFTAASPPSSYPGMMGIITGFAGTNMVTLVPPLHPDDAVGVSRIYPVAFPAPGNTKTPLINSTAEIRGYLLSQVGLGRFGDNVFPIERGLGTLTPNMPPGNASPPVVGTVSGTARFTSTDVVGAMDTGSGDVTSGAFRILGVPVNMLPGAMPYPDPIQYDIVAEDILYAGFLNSATFGEWFINTLMNPALNAIAPFGAQTRIISRDASLPSVIGGTTGAPGVLNPGAPFVGSFSVWPGSIIEAGSRFHGGPVPQLTVTDNESRPLLGIFPRSRPTSGNVTLLAISNYPLNPATAVLTVNGAPFSLLTPGVVITPVAPHTVQVDIPVTTAGFLPPVGVPARLRLTAFELGAPGLGIVFVRGINEVQY